MISRDWKVVRRAGRGMDAVQGMEQDGAAQRQGRCQAGRQAPYGEEGSSSSRAVLSLLCLRDPHTPDKSERESERARWT